MVATSKPQEPKKQKGELCRFRIGQTLYIIQFRNLFLCFASGCALGFLLLAFADIILHLLQMVGLLKDTTPPLNAKLFGL